MQTSMRGTCAFAREPQLFDRTLTTHTRFTNAQALAHTLAHTLSHALALARTSHRTLSLARGAHLARSRALCRSRTLTHSWRSVWLARMHSISLARAQGLSASLSCLALLRAHRRTGLHSHTYMHIHTCIYTHTYCWRKTAAGFEPAKSGACDPAARADEQRRHVSSCWTKQCCKES